MGGLPCETRIRQPVMDMYMTPMSAAIHAPTCLGMPCIQYKAAGARGRDLGIPSIYTLRIRYTVVPFPTPSCAGTLLMVATHHPLVKKQVPMLPCNSPMSCEYSEAQGCGVVVDHLAQLTANSAFSAFSALCSARSAAYCAWRARSSA